jgi:hypothetical protein
MGSHSLRRWPSVLRNALLVLMSFAFILSVPLTAYAVVDDGSGGGSGGAAPYTLEGMTPDKQSLSYGLYYGVVKCLTGINDISNNDVINGSIEGASNAWTLSYSVDKAYGDGKDGSTSCEAVIGGAVKLWGYSDVSQALLDWGYKNPGDGKDWHSDHPGRDTAAAIRKRVYSGNDPSVPNPAKYVNYITTLQQQCNISGKTEYSKASAALKSGADATSGAVEYVKVKEPSADYKTVVEYIYKVEGDKSTNKAWPANSPLSGQVGMANCRDIAKLASDNAAGFQQWALANPELAKKIDTGGTSAKSAEAGKSTCTIAGIGWIVCPVVNFLSGIADSAYGMVASMLTVPAVNTSDTNNALYQAWSIVRNLANICFVIAFLVIIYSQITSAGISNYGIKKLLPKLIISAVLVNISYWICALAVDISNFLGYAISSMFATIGKPITGETPTTLNSGNSFTALAAGVLVAGAAVAFLQLSMLLPLLVGAVLVIVVVVIILTLRQGLIVMLIVISPLAFVAYLLPNTSKLFDRWWDAFKALLLMFPVVAFVYAGSALAGKVLSGVAKDMDGGMKVGFQIMAAALPILSFITVYTLMKTSSALLGKFMNNNPAKGIGDRMKRGAENRGKRWDNQRGTLRNRLAASDNKWTRRSGLLVGGGASRRAKGKAIDRAAERNLQRSEEDLVAGRAAEGGRFAQQLSRGAGQEGLQRAISDAQFTIEEAEIKEAKAARVSFERSGLEGMGAMRTLDSGVGSDGKALTSAQKIALRSMVVEAGHAPDVAKVWDSMSGEGVSNSERNAFASDLTKNKPTGVGMGAIAKMRAGGNDTFDETVADGLVAGRYDAAGAAKSDNSELEMVRGLANNPSAMQGAIKRKLVGEINATRPEGQKITEADVSDDEVQKRTQQVLDKLRTDAHTASTDPRFNAGKARTTLDVIVKDLGGPPQAASTTSTPPTSTSHQGQTFNQTEGGLYIPRS